VSDHCRLISVFTLCENKLDIYLVEKRRETEGTLGDLFYRDGDAQHRRRRSDSRTERGFPPVTPVACMHDSILSAVFDDLMKKVRFILVRGAFKKFIDQHS